MTRTLAALTAATAACLLWATPSLAAPPVVVGQGQGGTPDIAVDPAGRAHIVWDDATPVLPAADLVRYCQLPRGASACGNAEAFSGSPAGIFGRPHVFTTNPAQVSVFYQRCCSTGEGTREVYSTNDGVDFAAETQIGDAVAYSASEAVVSPTFSYSLLSELSSAATVQYANFAPPVATTEAVLGSAGTNQGAIALQAGGRPVVVYQNQTSPWSFVWRKFSDSVAPDEASVNNAANWTAEAPVDNERATAASGPALAGGASGVFVFYQKRAPDQGFVRRFTGTGWTAPVKITDDPFNDLDLFQDNAGRLHAVWSAYTDGALRYRWSDDGITWSPVVDIARGENGYPQVRVSAAADHAGFAVWNRGGPDVVAVPLEGLPPLTGGPGPGFGSGYDPRVDVLPPVVGDFSVDRDTLFPGEGSFFDFNSSEAGLATLTVRRQVPGLKVRRGGLTVCVPRTRRLVRRISRSSASPAAFRRALRRRRCTARKTIGRITQAVSAGQNTIAFNGRIAGRRLRPGRYFALLQIRDAAGNLSRVETLQFRVLRPRRRR
jgi:hypothetical protein